MTSSGVLRKGQSAQTFISLIDDNRSVFILQTANRNIFISCVGQAWTLCVKICLKDNDQAPSRPFVYSSSVSLARTYLSWLYYGQQ